MSNIGKPLCSLQMEQKYGPRGSSLVKFLYGDLVEDIVLFLIHASGLEVVSELEPVSLKIAGKKINGTLDVVIKINGTNYVFDIKSASDFSFRDKQNNSFKHFIEQDFFGYTTQLFMYAEAKGYTPGGFIFANKVDGEIFVLAVPEEYEEYKNIALSKAKNNILAINNPFERKFEDIEETFYKKKTGNRHLGFTCSYCDYKFECWKDLKIQPQINSKSKNPKIVYYTSIKEEE